MTTKLECFLPFLATCHDFLSPLSPGSWFNIMVTSYQYRKSHCGDKMIFWPSYLHNRISHTGKITSLYWNGFLTMSFKMADKISTSLVAVWVLYLYVLNLSEGAKRYTTGNWNPSPSKIRAYLFYIVSIMADLALIAQFSCLRLRQWPVTYLITLSDWIMSCQPGRHAVVTVCEPDWKHKWAAYKSFDETSSFNNL